MNWDELSLAPHRPAMSSSHDSVHSVTSQLVSGLLLGNLLAILAALAYRPAPGAIDTHGGLVLGVGVLSLVSAAMLFMAGTMRRRTVRWWGVAVALDIAQLVRLLLAAAALDGWAEQGLGAWVVWVFVFLPFLCLLAAVGIVMTAREMRKGRRRHLSHAA